MKYRYQFLKRINKLGVLITQFLVTVILVVKKLHNIVYLSLSVRHIMYKLRIYCSSPTSITLDIMLKVTESTNKAFGDYLSSLNSPEVKQDKEIDILVSGIPCSISRTDPMEIIARMFEFHFKHDINWNLLEAQINNPILLVTAQPPGLSPDRPSITYE
jgi:hypothetical protein